jgi:hypothetical protein
MLAASSTSATAISTPVSPIVAAQAHLAAVAINGKRVITWKIAASCNARVAAKNGRDRQTFSSWSIGRLRRGSSRDA